MRHSFFRTSAEGEFAYISDAVEGPQARTLYSKWCLVRDGSTIKASGPVLYFGINNRSTQAGEGNYFLVKIFRLSDDTRRDPLISYRRSGAWRNPRCRGHGSSGGFDYVAKGIDALREFYELLKNPSPQPASDCKPFQRWLGWAFGRSDRSLYGELSFLKTVPPRVINTGVRNWSLNLLASTYTTALRGGLRTAPFPLFEVTRYREEEMIVQVLSGGRMTTFRVTS